MDRNMCERLSNIQNAKVLKTCAWLPAILNNAKRMFIHQSILLKYQVYYDWAWYIAVLLIHNNSNYELRSNGKSQLKSMQNIPGKYECESGEGTINELLGLLLSSHWYTIHGHQALSCLQLLHSRASFLYLHKERKKVFNE